MDAMRILGWVLVVILVGITAAPLLPFQVWYVRVWEFPRVQIFVLTVVGVVLCGWLLGPLHGRALAAVVLLSLCALWQGLKILPYTPFWPVESKEVEVGMEGERVRVLISNVLLQNRNTVELKKLIEAETPDLLLLMEVDRWWLESLAPVTNDYSFRLEKPQDNMYGMALYSQLPLEEPQVRFLVNDETPSTRATVRLPSGNRFVFFGLHPEPPAPTGAFTSAKRDAELVVVASEVEVLEAPVIVAGDLNDVAWSHTTKLFRALSGCLDPRVGRGTYGTFHAAYPFLRYPLDHLFHSAEWRLVEIRVLSYVGSDHFPVVAELQLAPEGQQEQEQPPPDHEQKVEGYEFLEKARQEKRDEEGRKPE